MMMMMMMSIQQNGWFSNTWELIFEKHVQIYYLPHDQDRKIKWKCSTGASMHREERLHLLPFLPLSHFHFHGYWRKGIPEAKNPPDFPKEFLDETLFKKDKFRRKVFHMRVDRFPKQKMAWDAILPPPRILSRHGSRSSCFTATMESWEKGLILHLTLID